MGPILILVMKKKLVLDRVRYYAKAQYCDARTRSKCTDQVPEENAAVSVGCSTYKYSPRIDANLFRLRRAELPETFVGCQRRYTGAVDRFEGAPRISSRCAVRCNGTHLQWTAVARRGMFGERRIDTTRGVRTSQTREGATSYCCFDVVVIKRIIIPG